MKFEIGDKALLITAVPEYQYLLGSECIIVDFAKERDNAYIVEFDGLTHDENGRYLIAFEIGLKKIDDDKASWDIVAKATGWSPPKIKEVVDASI